MSPAIDRIQTAALRIVGPSLVVKVWAGDMYGLGECYPSAPVRAVHEAVVALAEQLDGEDPRDVEPLVEKMRRWHLFTGAQGGTVVTAISGLEMALWDLAGKLQGVPVYRLLGGAYRQRVALYADCDAGTVDAAGHHTVGSASAEVTSAAVADIARGAVAAGFGAVKVDVDDVLGPDARDVWNRSLSRREIDGMSERVGAVREAVGPHVELAVDMHARYDVASAVRAADALAEHDLLWLEEPVPPEDTAGLADVRRRARVPIAAGENRYWRHGFRDLLEVGAVDTVTPDLAKFGGLAEGKRVADMAELHDVAFAPHNVSGSLGTVAAAHVCAAASNATWLEFHALDLPDWATLVTRPAGAVIEDGAVTLDDTPGLGVELDEDAARAHVHERAALPFFGDVG